MANNEITKTAEQTMPNVEQAVRNAYKQCGEAMQRGNWMIAAFYVDDEGRITVSRTTWQYPMSAATPSARLLVDSLQSDLIPAPLPVANTCLKCGAAIPIGRVGLCMVCQDKNPIRLNGDTVEGD